MRGVVSKPRLKMAWLVGTNPRDKQRLETLNVYKEKFKLKKNANKRKRIREIDFWADIRSYLLFYT